MNNTNNTNNTVRLIGVDSEELIEELAQLAYEIWTEHFTPIIGKAQVEYMISRFQSADAIRNQIENEGYTYLLADDRGEKVGYTGFRRDGERMFLSKLYVRKDRRGRGISRLMLDEIASRCGGLSDIYLTVNKHNDGTVRIYEHMGFKRTASAVTDIGGGFVMDDYIYSLPVEAALCRKQGKDV